MVSDRPSKRQQELLQFLCAFIETNGYGPSYREVMRALDYKSVSTVAVHVDGLIARGLLRKKDHSARSLEIVTESKDNAHIAWLKREIKKRQTAEDEKARAQGRLLQAALEILLDQSDR